jgi:hypothetical protein
MSAAPAQDKKKNIVIGVFSVLLLIFVIYAYNAFFGGSSAPAPAAAPVPVQTTTTRTSGSGAAQSRAENSTGGGTGQGAVAGIAAQKIASTGASLDPTLDESAMLRTESLVYAGTGRNIFSATYVAPVAIPTNYPKARPGPVAAVAPPQPTGPPPPPPINLRFFGVAVRTNGVKQAFLLNGDDVYLASVGDIVARKYKIVSIGTSNIQVEDLQNANTQSLPLQN